MVIGRCRNSFYVRSLPLFTNLDETNSISKTNKICHLFHWVECISEYLGRGSSSFLQSVIYMYCKIRSKTFVCMFVTYNMEQYIKSHHNMLPDSVSCARTTYDMMGDFPKLKKSFVSGQNVECRVTRCFYIRPFN